MATQIQRIENSILNKVYVKSEKALKEMVDDGQLQILSEYFTPDSDIEMPAMPVGSIFISAIPITDARVHLLDGSTIAQTGVYETFANLIKALDSAGNSITCTQAEFDADVTATGNCGKFVIDNDAGTIRLPKITTFIQGLSDLTNIGSSLSAGIPNIKGSTSVRSGYGTFNAQNAFITSGVYGADSESGSSSERGLLTFDASKGEIKKDGTYKNDVYGNSDTVQPNATQYPYYIVLASGYKSSQVVDIDNIMNEVNSKTTLLDVYPVGSVYLTMATDTTGAVSPASFMGGIWERLPDGYTLWTASSGAGETISAGLPNITSKSTTYTQICGWTGSGNVAVGALVGRDSGYTPSGGSYGRFITLDLDASRSSDIYGKSTTVQPPAIKVYAWQRVE